jgi:aliphatic nitrilase
MAQHEQIHCSQFPGSLVGPVFAEQMEVTMRHHALESGCFVVNATAWLTPEQVKSQAPTPELEKAFAGGCYSAIISPEGKHLAEPLREGAGMVVADLDFALITKRKRMMDSVGHYARPELLSLQLDSRPAAPLAAAHAPQAPAADPGAQEAQRLAHYLDGQRPRAAGLEASYLEALASFTGRPA